MPGYVFDSSAIAVILGVKRGEAVRLLRGGATICLAYYELCNVVWKEAALLRRVAPREALETAGYVALILREMRVEHLTSPEDLRGVLDLALKTGLTAYDSSYLYAAKKLGAVLVTEDEELREAARNCGVEALSVDQYLDAARAP